MKNFNKQFFISNVDVSKHFNDVNHFKFKDIFVIVDKNLKFINTHDKDGKQWLVLGVIITLNNNFKTVNEEIESTLSCNIHNTSKFWSGRWVLIGDDGVYGDASHLLGIYHHVNKSNDYYISSSLYALGQILKIKQHIVPQIPNHIVHFIAPGTGFEGIEKLLVGTYFSFNDRSIKEEIAPIYLNFSSLKYDDIIDQLNKLLHLAFKRINDLSYAHFLLALTSGLDSRLLLPYAIDKIDKDKFATYFQEFNIGNKKDERISKLVAKQYNLHRTYVKENKFNKEKFDFFTEFSSNHNIDNDRAFYSRGQWDFGKKNTLIIRGAGFHPDRNVYIMKGEGAIDSEDPNFLNKMAYNLRVKEDYQYNSLKKWYKFYKSTEKRYAFVDYRDRLYTEQRQGAWMSAIEQSLDIQSKDSIHPANNKLILSYIVSLDIDKRKDRNHHVDLIKKNDVKQFKYPFNPEKSFFNRIENSFKFRLIKYFNIRY